MMRRCRAAMLDPGGNCQPRGQNGLSESHRPVRSTGASEVLKSSKKSSKLPTSPESGSTFVWLATSSLITRAPRLDGSTYPDTYRNGALHGTYCKLGEGRWTQLGPGRPRSSHGPTPSGHRSKG